MMDVVVTPTHLSAKPDSRAIRASLLSHLMDLSLTRRFSFVAGLMVLAACSDAPTAPQRSIDRVAAARVMPSVTDARIRLSPGIENLVIRERVQHDLQDLETALTNGDGQKASFHVRVLADVLSSYRTQQGSQTTDGADVTAIGLMLVQVSEVVDASFDLGSFQ